MKILVFEFITGGGLSKEALPASLAKEGAIMLHALVDDLLALSHVEILLMLDERISVTRRWSESDRLQIIKIDKTMDVEQIFAKSIALCDAVWPIAPESDNLLEGICRKVESSDKVLLSSSAEATAVAGNKLRTSQWLNKQGVASAATDSLADFPACREGEWVVKPIDGAGCAQTMLIRNKREFRFVKSQLSDLDNYIIQPYLRGKPLSLSCLFKQGRGWLLCCNEQCVELVGNRFRLTGCRVNIKTELSSRLQPLVARIALAMPGLWGYAGIDLIASERDVSVLEINPRLTTSYAGIRSATGLNVAQNVLQLIDGDPVLTQNKKREVIVDIMAGEYDAA